MRTCGRLVSVGAVALAAAFALTACGSSGSSASGQTSTSASSTAPGSTAATGGASTGSGTKAPIKIGVIGSFSGFASDTTKLDPAGLQAWASATNASGGINGHQVQVYVEDDQGSPALSLTEVKKLVEEDHVISIVAPWEQGLEATWASYIDSKKIPVVGGEADETQWMTDPNFFPGSTGQVVGLTMGAYASKLAGVKGYGIVYCAEAPACAQAVSLTKQAVGPLGVKFVGGLPLAASASNYTAQCLSLKEKGADMVFMATGESTAVRFLQSCNAQGYKPIPMQYAGTYLKTLNTDPAWNGEWLMSPAFSWLSTDPAVQAFNTAMAKYQPNTQINGAATVGWAGGVLFGKAAANVSDTPTAADIYKGLYALGPNYTAGGLIPPVTFAPGKAAVQKPCAWYMRLVDGKLTSPKGTEQICINS
jgi:branched-chain amino acid transport system substrate-binding protein